ncbi:MAG: D-amino-acid transaminase [Gammaproteobacteria bacterium]
MGTVAYVNGDFVPEATASVSIFDRGFIFGEGIYEVTSVLRGRLVDNDGHLARLKRSLGELGMVQPIDNEAIVVAQRELIERNGVDEGVVYLQITRGAAPRDFAYPHDAEPTLIMFTQRKAIVENPQADTGISVITLPEIRWQRRDIKTVSLLAACMGKQAALDAGADDAWFIENGFVTEGTSNNAYIVTPSGKLVTRNLGSEILKGVTRMAVLAVSQENGIEVEERPFSLEETRSCSEAFSTSASTFVMPVVKIDDHSIGNGQPGPLTARLRKMYIDFALASV